MSRPGLSATDTGGLHAQLELQAPGPEVTVRLQVAAGERVALFGPSGAGKTTVLRCLAGLLRPAQGRIACDGRVWLDTGRGIDLPPERRRCASVAQTPALFPHLSVWRNVAFALADRPRGERRAEAEAWLARVGAESLAGRRPGTLSGGERQRVALARALARRPAVLLLDEPLAALDAAARAEVRGTLREVLEATAVPTVLVTHSWDEAAELCGRAVVLEDGRVVQAGIPPAIAAAPASAWVQAATGGDRRPPAAG